MAALEDAIDLARAAIDRLAARLGMDALATAEGVIAVVTANMARAIRVISVQRGHDPRAITRWSRSAAPDADVPMLDWSKRLVCS